VNDIYLAKNRNGIYDISFSSGDFKKTQGLDTAIINSLNIDQRAEASEVATPQNRRGNIIDELNNESDFQIGSKLWLLSQKRANQETASLAESYASECLQWLVDDGIAQTVIVSGILKNDNIVLSTTIKQSDGTTFNKSYDLWSKTTIA
jgi:phage gp46-like protein